jgi:hypothetical protein
MHGVVSRDEFYAIAGCQQPFGFDEMLNFLRIRLSRPPSRTPAIHEQANDEE